MKRMAFVFIMIAVAAATAFANGNAEKLTTIEGTVTLIPGEGAGDMVMLRTANGDEVLIDMPVQERLRLEVGAKVRVNGVFVGAPSGQKVQAKILARTVTANGRNYNVENPAPVTEQDRLRIRDCEAELAQTRTQTQDQTRTQDQDRTMAKDGSGDGSQKGK